MFNFTVAEDGRLYRSAQRFDSVMDRIDARLRQFSLLLVVLLVGVVVLNVIMRYVFSESLLWANELSRYLMVWFALLATASLVNSDDHLNVGIVFDRFSDRLKYWLQSTTMALYVVLGLVWVNFGLEYAISAGLNAEAPAMNFPLLWVYIVIPISGAFVSLFALARLLRLVVLGETESLETAYDVDQRGGESDD
ncbi:TRAP transporter small permease [Halomicrobium salinisoli]|uniref:TRAP transporter small permease n=1 Tax=Halomicrobium salinisoli TaxID=2878391 RepID=UPI001CEFFF19|nr:TRAP transporter small permease [Halomicrobium salinisoli]